MENNKFCRPVFTCTLGGARFYLVQCNYVKFPLSDICLKRDDLRYLSWKCYCDSRSQYVDEWLVEKTDGIGADVFFECVSKNETLKQAVRLTGAAGRVMLVDNPAGDDDWHMAVKAIQAGKIRPSRQITHRFSFDALSDGLSVMRDRDVFTNKVMMEKLFSIK